jgi:hypothetical protein
MVPNVTALMMARSQMPCCVGRSFSRNVALELFILAPYHIRITEMMNIS